MSQTVQRKPIPGPIATQSPGKLFRKDNSSRPGNQPSLQATTPSASRVLPRFPTFSWRKVFSIGSPSAPRLGTAHQRLEAELGANGANKKQMLQVKNLLGRQGGDILMRNPGLLMDGHARDYQLMATGTYVGKSGASIGIKLEGLLPYAKGDEVLSTGAKLACEVWIDEKGKVTSRIPSEPEKEAREYADGRLPLVLEEEPPRQAEDFAAGAGDSKLPHSVKTSPYILSPTEYQRGERKGSIPDGVPAQPGAVETKTRNPADAIDVQAAEVSGGGSWVSLSIQAHDVLSHAEALLKNVKRPITFVERPGYSHADHIALARATHEVETQRLILMRALADCDDSEKSLRTLSQTTQALEDAVEVILQKLEARSQSLG